MNKEAMNHDCVLIGVCAWRGWECNSINVDFSALFSLVGGKDALLSSFPSPHTMLILYINM